MPYSASFADTIGPMARTVTDCAIALDVMAGYTLEDPKTLVSIGCLPAGGYAGGLSETALAGARLGVFGPGWRDQPLSPETRRLFDAALDLLKAEGAVIVEDPFAGSGFAELMKTLSPDADFKVTLPYDFQLYLDRLGPGSPVRSFDAFRTLPVALGFLDAPHLGKSGDLFADGGVLEAASGEGIYSAALANPASPPPTDAVVAAVEAFIARFDEVLERFEIDAMIFPQVTCEPPALFSSERINTPTSIEINIPGLPAVVVPAGKFASGVPFSLTLVGRRFSDGRLLAFAYDFEQATRLRVIPELMSEAAPGK